MTRRAMMNAGKRGFAVLIGILLLAAYLRLNHLDWTEFKLDEANLSRLSLNFVRGVEFPLTGIGSSTGIVNLPLAAWLLAIPYAASPSPIVATAFVGLLNVIAVAGCFGLAYRWFTAASKSASAPFAALRGSSRDASYGDTAALVATLLFAVAPWAVIHSRKVWAQNLLPPFVLLWAWTGWLAFGQPRPRALIGHALSLAVCIQLHYSGVWLAPVTLLWAIAFARRIPWRMGLAALAAFAATFAPFVIADALRGGENVNRLVEILGRPAQLDGEALRLAWLMMTGQEIHALAGPQEFENFLAGVPGGELGFGLTAAVGVLVALGALVALVDTTRAIQHRSFDDRSAAAFMMVTWLAVPVLLQVRHSLPVFPHYFIILYPVPFLLVGWLVGRSANRRTSLAWKAVVSLVVVIAALQSVHSLALQAFMAERATPGGFGVPIGMTLRLAETAARASRDRGGAEVLVYAEGDNPFAHDGPAIFDVLLPANVPRRFVDLGQSTEVYPLMDSVLIVYSPGGLILPEALGARAELTGPDAVVPLRTGEGAAEVRALAGERDARRRCGSAAPIGRWRNGVDLMRVRAAGEWRGEGGRLELCFAVVAPDGMDVHWFNHILGPDGQRWAQVDGAGFPSVSWRAGDVIVARFGPVILPADAPPGRYTLRVGMYTYPEVANVPLVDAGGSAIGDSARVDLGDLVP